MRELLIVKNEGRANAAWLLEEGSVTVQQGASMVADSLTIAENQTRQEYKGPSLDMRGTATVITQLQTASLRIVGGGDWTVQSGMFLLQSSSLEVCSFCMKRNAPTEVGAQCARSPRFVPRFRGTQTIKHLHSTCGQALFGSVHACHT